MVNSLLEQNDPLEQLALYRKLKDQSQSNNDFDDLVNKLNLDYNMLKNNCPAIFSTNVGKDSGLDDILDYGSSVNTKAQYNRNKYFKLVKNGNNYIDKLLNAEEDYFTSKYGDKIYDYLKEKRKKYIKKKISSDFITPIGNSIDLYKDILNEEWNTYSDISNANIDKIFNNYKNAIDIISSDVNTMINETDTNNRKIEYRDELQGTVIYANNLITIFYYIALFIIFFVLAVKGSLELYSRWWLYILVLLFPLFIYPLLYKFIVFIYLKINEKLNFNGPKGAFLNNIYDDLKFLDDYDI